jgi:hypothetical protein
MGSVHNTPQSCGNYIVGSMPVVDQSGHKLAQLRAWHDTCNNTAYAQIYTTGCLYVQNVSINIVNNGGSKTYSPYANFCNQSIYSPSITYQYKSTFGTSNTADYGTTNVFGTTTQVG